MVTAIAFPPPETAEKLTGTVNVLSSRSKDLSADKLKRVDVAVKNLATALDDLHDVAPTAILFTRSPSA